MTPDIKAIRAAAEADANVATGHGKYWAYPTTVIALCDEVDRLRHTNGNPLSMLGIDQLRDENKELRQEVERLRKDAARLDWLNENGGEAGLSQTPSGWRLRRGLDSTHHQTLHDAIDAAMETKCLNQ